MPSHFLPGPEKLRACSHGDCDGGRHVSGVDGDDSEVQFHEPGYHHVRIDHCHLFLYFDPCPNSSLNPGRHVSHSLVDLRELNDRV